MMDQIPVDDAAFVRGREPHRHLPDEIDHPSQRQLATTVSDRARQLAALEQLHDQVGPAVGQAIEVEHSD
jgi:hypothetical protein